MSWITAVVKDGEFHTFPKNDWIVHEKSENCVCGPHCEVTESDYSGMSFYYIHYALDGRDSEVV